MGRVVLIVVATVCAACRSAGGGNAPAVVQPGAPGKTTRVVAAADSLAAAPRHTPADVRFMQGMIGHHAQAVEMTALLQSRTASDEMRKLAQRIELSQVDEITMMREWLTARGQPVPEEHAHHVHGAPRMPGMLTPEEMQRLAAAKGIEFDRRFLEYMIKHHQGAIVMVRELFSTPGAGQEAEIFAFASDVEADQLIEIRRMGVMLSERRKSPQPSKEFEK